jgi:hypothetical protein
MSARRKLDLLWRWSPLLTLPVAVVFAGWAASTWSNYREFALEYDAQPVVVRLHDVGVDEWNQLARRTLQAVSTRTLADVPQQYALNTVQLFVEGDDFARLNGDLPYSGYKFQDGQLMFRDGLHKVRVRYRGDFLVHWAYDKKSIRVRTAKDDELFEGMRAFNLIVPKFPEQVNNYLGYRLAQRLGLMSPRCELVNVSINGRNAGLCEFTEQLDENTLRRWHRVPGDFYSGDLVSKTAIWGTTNRVFEMPQAWEKIAADPAHDVASRAPLQRLLELLNTEPGEATEAALSALLDMDAFGAFGAFEVLTQTHHYDEYHNWRLYWDPCAQRFQPVIWDPIAWAPDMRSATGARPSLDMVVSRLQVWLHRNGDFLAARQRTLRDFYASGAVDQFTAEVDWALAAARHAVEFDPNTRPTDTARVFDGMQRFRSFFDDVIRDVRVAYVDGNGGVRYTLPDAQGVMAVEVDGRRPVDEVVLHFRAPVTAAVGAELRTRRAAERGSCDLRGGVVVQGNTVRVPARLFAQLEPRCVYAPGQVLRQRALESVPTCYELQLTDLPPDNPLLDVGVVRDGRPERAELAAALTPSDLFWLYRPCTPVPARRPQTWSGQLTVTGVREVTDDVVIEPGTLIRMAPGASVVFAGRVTAAGTTEQPIRVVPAHDGQDPWGTFALNGPRCSGSTFRNCKLRGGSGHKTPLAHFGAMFAIHGCRDVRVEDCRFADNAVADDMVHCTYAQVQFDRCELVKAFTNALGCDLSEVVVRNSRFVDNGRTGIELMATRALVHDCQFVHDRDQGIALGDGSTLAAVRDTFNGCGRAVEAGDGAVVRAANCEFRDCKRALHAGRKDVRYGNGGDVEVHKSVFAGNVTMPTADARSRLQLIDCQLDKPLPARFRDGDREVDNHAAVLQCGKGPTAALRLPLPFPTDLLPLESLAGELWTTVRTDVRGATRGD